MARWSRASPMWTSSAITGESAPVIKEPGTDMFSSVTAGTLLISDLLVRATANPGESFLDRMIHLVEGAKRQKTPNEMALTALLAILDADLSSWSSDGARRGVSAGTHQLADLIALLVALIPTPSALSSAIGIAGINHTFRFNSRHVRKSRGGRRDVHNFCSIRLARYHGQPPEPSSFHCRGRARANSFKRLTLPPLTIRRPIPGLHHGSPFTARHTSTIAQRLGQPRTSAASLQLAGHSHRPVDPVPRRMLSAPSSSAIRLSADSRQILQLLGDKPAYLLARQVAAQNVVFACESALARRGLRAR